MLRYVLVFCCIYATLTPNFANATTDEQKAKIHERLEAIGAICIKDNPISEEDMARLQAKTVPPGPDSGCFLACMMRQVGLLNDAGMLFKETALEHAKAIVSDPIEVKLLEDYVHSCAHVNDKDVSDGDKGCERALLAYECMNDNASQFDFEI